MPGIAVAESKESPRKGRKVLHHIEIHPRMGGGHTVQHHYTDGAGSREYHFGEDEGERAAAHLSRHLHLPQLGGTSETEEEIAEAPVPEKHVARKGEKKPVKAEGSMHENARDAHYEGE